MEETKCIPLSAVQTVFSNITIILQLHEKLYSELEQRMITWSAEQGRLGDIILTMVFLKKRPSSFKSLIQNILFSCKKVPFMKMYTDYVNNYDAALSMLSHLHKNKKFTAFLQVPICPIPSSSCYHSHNYPNLTEPKDTHG